MVHRHPTLLLLSAFLILLSFQLASATPPGSLPAGTDASAYLVELAAPPVGGSALSVAPNMQSAWWHAVVTAAAANLESSGG